MNAIIIEDEPKAARRLEQLAQSIAPEIVVLQTIDSVKKSVQWLKENPRPDLIFMDIMLADGISFQIFEQVEITSSVIFTTAYDEYALKAFKVNSIDYILKPVDEAELSSAIQKYKRLSRAPDSHKIMDRISLAIQMITKRYKERFVIKVGEHLKSIETADIMFFVSVEKTTFAHTSDGRKNILDLTMDQLDDLLDPSKFFRINRKYIVNVKSIQDMISYSNSRLRLVLSNSTDNEVIVARERLNQFKEWLDA